MKSRKRSVGKRGRAGLTVAIVVAIASSVVVGMSTAAPAATNLPTAPRSPAAGPTNGGALVRWVAPTRSGSSPIVSYVITPFRGDVAGRARVFRSKATTQVFAGLRNGKTYTFRVAAHSAAGTGPQSVFTSAIVVGTPMAATNLKAKAGSASALLTWSAPAKNNGAVVKGYLIVTIAKNKVIKRQTFNRGATLVIVSGLRNGVGYRFTVQAKNARGVGPASKRSNTIVPKPLTAAKPPAAGYFTQLPPGAALPSGAACAARVHQSSWEPRADNYTANHTVPKQPVNLASSFPYTSAWQTADRPRITGNFTGTTDEIIQWVACKWGWSDNVVRAQAVIESHWHQSTRGDYESRSGGHCVFDSTADPCPTSFGIIQVRWYFHPEVSNSAASNSSYPAIRTSTAFNLDLELAEMRGCYDGRSTYLGNTRGDLWGCLGVWFSGAWHSSGGDNYASKVQQALAAKDWLTWPNEG
jgi:hypothetical protein